MWVCCSGAGICNLDCGFLFWIIWVDWILSCGKNFQLGFASLAQDYVKLEARLIVDPLWIV